MRTIHWWCAGWVIGVMLSAGVSSVYADGRVLYTLTQQAQAAASEGRYEEAEDFCLQLIRLKGDFYPAYTILGIVYAQGYGDIFQAINYLEYSLELNPKQPALYNQLSFLYNKTGARDKGFELIHSGLGLFPDSFDLNFNAGLLYLLSQKDAHQALAFFLIADKLKPDNAKTLFLVGFSYFLTNQQPQALTYITRLRHINNEYLASRLEKAMRKVAEGGEVDVGGIMTDYTTEIQRLDEAETVQPEVSARGQASTTSRLSPTTNVTVRGTGTVRVERQYKVQDNAVVPEQVGLTPQQPTRGKDKSVGLTPWDDL